MAGAANRPAGPRLRRGLGGGRWLGGARRAAPILAEIFRVFPLVVLPLSQAGLAAGLGVPALRLREMILIARWFADDRVLTAAEALG